MEITDALDNMELNSHKSKPSVGRGGKWLLLT